MIDTPEENTIDPRKARKALDESRASKAATAAIIDEARRTFDQVRQHRVDNHYRDKFRAIIRGGIAS